MLFSQQSSNDTSFFHQSSKRHSVKMTRCFRQNDTSLSLKMIGGFFKMTYLQASKWQVISNLLCSLFTAVPASSYARVPRVRSNWIIDQFSFHLWPISSPRFWPVFFWFRLVPMVFRSPKFKYAVSFLKFYL